MNRDQIRIALAALGLLALVALGVAVAALVSGGNEKAASGAATTLCAHAEVPPAKSDACVLYPSGETVPPPTTLPTVPTETGTTPTVPTTPTDTPTPNPDDFKLSACNPVPNKVVCIHNPAQAWKVPDNANLDLVQIVITENSPGTKDAMFASGCCSDHGVIRRLEIRNEKCDGVKQSGRNLDILGGFVDLPRLRPPYEPGGLDCHVDAFQLGCSVNVHVKNMAIRGWGHSGFFVNCEDADKTKGHDVTLEKSYVMRSPEGPQPFDTDVTIGDSDTSGVIGSTLCTALQWEVYIPKTPSTGGDQARNPVVEDNTIEEGPIPVDGCAATD